MKRFAAFLLAALILVSCTQPVIERYYYAEPTAEEPAPVEPAPEPYVPTEYERFLLYVVDTTGAIIYQDDCNILTGGWASKYEKYEMRMRCFRIEVEMNGQTGPGRPWKILTDQTYIE